jgi:hypothetical protein
LKITAKHLPNLGYQEYDTGHGKFSAHLDLRQCCSKVIMSGVNGNVIMSGYGNENPDDEGREAARDNTKSVSRGVNDGEGIVGAGSQ